MPSLRDSEPWFSRVSYSEWRRNGLVAKRRNSIAWGEVSEGERNHRIDSRQSCLVLSEESLKVLSFGSGVVESMFPSF